jgi:hypothetical protein
MNLTTIKVEDSIDHKNINIVKMKMKLGLIFENKIVEMKFEKVISNIKIILYHIISYNPVLILMKITSIKV